MTSLIYGEFGSLGGYDVNIESNIDEGKGYKRIVSDRLIFMRFICLQTTTPTIDTLSVFTARERLQSLNASQTSGFDGRIIKNFAKNALCKNSNFTNISIYREFYIDTVSKFGVKAGFIF